MAVFIKLWSCLFTTKLSSHLWRNSINVISENLHTVLTYHIATLYNVILRIAKNLLETRVIIKISTHPCYPRNFHWFSWGWSRKRKKIEKKRFKMADSIFSIPPILNIFSRKFQGLVLGWVGQIDAKGIDVAQPIWSSGCPT